MANILKQSKCQQTGNEKKTFIHNSGTTNELETHTATWMNLKDITLDQRRQA